MFDIVLGRSPSDTKKLKTKGTVMIGKQYVEMGDTSSLANPIYMDVSRAHAMLIVGKRGCLREDALVFTDSGYKKIKEIDEKKDKILSFNKNTLEFGWEKNVKLLQYDTSKDETMFKLHLQDGQELTLTSEHPLLVYRNKKLSWIIAEELKEGDDIVSLYKFPDISYKIKKEETLRIARLLGFILADGNLFEKKGEYKDSRGYKYNGRKTRVRIVNSDKEILEQAKKDLEEEFKTSKTNIYKKDKNCFNVENHSQRVFDKLKSLGIESGNKNKKIEIPKIVWQSSKKFKSQFLKALFSCDGYISKDGKIFYYSNSKKIISQINLLLGEFGIQSRFREKKVKLNNKEFISNELYITDFTSFENFKEKIGFFPEHKKERLNHRKFNQVSKRKKTKYINDELFCQKIKSIEKITGIKKVYDLRVPINNSFVVNGIISHNSGKSYTMGSIAEGLADMEPETSKNLSFFLLDTMGVYWSMKYPNKKEEEFLKKWGLEGKGLNVQIYVPGGFYEKYKKDGVPVDFPFYIQPKELAIEDWMNAFNLSTDDPIGVAIQRTVNKALDSRKNFDIDDLIEICENDKRLDDKTKLAVVNRFENTKTWGIFSKKGTPINHLLKGGTVTVMDLSAYVALPGGWEVKALVLGLIAKLIFINRMLVRKREELYDIVNKTQVVKKEEVEDDLPMPWLIIDECLPYNSIILTNKGRIPIGEIVENYSNFKPIKVLGYDQKEKTFDYYSISKVFDQGTREIIELKTETGDKINCTPDHKVFDGNEFCEAKITKSLAFPIEPHTYYSMNKEEITARLIGSIYGDGWLSINGVVGFSSNNDNRNLLKIKEDLKIIGFKSSNIYTRKTISKIKNHNNVSNQVIGTNNSIHCSKKAFEYFKSLGVPIGKRTNTNFEIPSFIMNGSKEIKQEFLAALFGADGNIPSQTNKRKSDYNPIRLTFYKEEKLKQNGIKYAKQIKKLFSDLGIKISNIYIKEGNIRVNNTRSIRFEITIAKELNNTIKFFQNIGYRYSFEKEREAIKWLKYLKTKKEELKKTKRLHKKALKLQKEKKWGKRKIAKELEIPEYLVREWIYYNREPNMPWLFPSYKKWCENRCKENTIIEKIISKKNKKPEKVYDLSVEKVHNFIAEGFIVHNCHEFLPETGDTPASKALMTILREGRQPGVSLIMATQQPAKIHMDAITQSDIVLAHRLTASFDLQALDRIFLSYNSKGSKALFNSMPRVKGCAIIMDDKNERLHTMQVRPRISWHGGEDPSAIDQTKDEFDF